MLNAKFLRVFVYTFGGAQKLNELDNLFIRILYVMLCNFLGV